MTVADLIKQLQKCPSKARVVFYDGSRGLEIPIDSITYADKVVGLFGPEGDEDSWGLE